MKRYHYNEQQPCNMMKMNNEVVNFHQLPASWPTEKAIAPKKNVKPQPQPIPPTPEPKPELFQIWYKTIDNTEDGGFYEEGFGATCVSQEFDQEKGMWCANFDGNVTSLPNNVFRSDDLLTEITLPDSITEIGLQAFVQCVNLKTFNMGDGITVIGAAAFAACDKLETVKFSKNLEYVNESAFNSCSSLKSAIMPESVSTIGQMAFVACHSLETVKMPGVSSIGKNAFTEDFALTNVEFSKDLYIINDHAFASCTSLKSISLGKVPQLLEIGNYVFSNCESLEKVELDNISIIGSKVFENCTSLKDIYVYNAVPDINEDTFKDIASNGTVHVDSDLVSSFMEWMINEQYYPRYYNWTIVPED